MNSFLKIVGISIAGLAGFSFYSNDVAAPDSCQNTMSQPTK